jgi:hypothetical protein
MEAVVTLGDVNTFETSGGNVRYVVRDAEGNEYTTFREAIGTRAQELQGRHVRIEYHKNQRGRYTNVYLDKVEPAPRTPATSTSGRLTLTGRRGGPQWKRRRGWSVNPSPTRRYRLRSCTRS